MRLPIFVLLSGISAFVHAGMFADFIGAYLADTGGHCKRQAEPNREINLYGVCIPQAVLKKEKRELIILAITELKSPEKLETVMQGELLMRQPTEAYRVTIESQTGDLIKLLDGTVVKKSAAGYTGLPGVRKPAIFYKHGKQWKLCTNHHTFEVDIVEYVALHYSKSVMQGETVRHIEQMDQCT